MSKDIKSYFLSTNKSKSEEHKKKIIVDSRKSSKKKRVFIESDSDEEKPQPKKANNSSFQIKKNEVLPTRSKYFEVCTPENVFGNKPIKRIPPKKTIKNTSDIVMELDDDFEATLMQMSEVDADELKEKSKQNNQFKEGYVVDTNSDKIKNKPSLLSKDPIDNCSHGESSHMAKFKNASSSSNKIDNTKEVLNTQPDKLLDKEIQIKESCGINFQNKINLENIEQNVNLSPNKKTLLKNDKISSTSSINDERKMNFNNIAIDKKSEIKTDLKNVKQNTSQEEIKYNLWVEKYRPKSLKNIVGQQGEKSNIKKLLFWLKNWSSNHIGKKKLNKPSPWAKDDTGAFFKAALLSGPPGIGKTTSAHLVCKELGFDLVEFNASDTRSKKLLHQEISELLSSKSLTPFFEGNAQNGNEVSKNHVLIMDEVDGMAGNEDRGGIQELLQLIKSTRIPIICMCNDRNHPKIRTLANYCFDLRFHRPRLEQIRGAMMTICYKESLKVPPNILNNIITCANQDIRLIINHLSIMTVKNTNLESTKKNIKLGPWDVVRQVFTKEEHKTMSFHDKCDLFFHDYSIGPLFVQENYLAVTPHSENAKTKRKKMELFARAADSISFGDITDKVIRSQNAWNLLPTQAIFSSYIPGEVLAGHMNGQINFPSWLGKNSKQGKLDRFLQEIQSHTRLRVSSSKEGMNLDYIVPLRDLITRPLIERGLDGVTTALSFLLEYNLIREDLDIINELCLWPNSKDPMTKIESKVKAAFTRAYNKSGMLPPYAISSGVKKGSKTTNGEDLLENDDEFLEEEENNIEVDAMITIKKQPVQKSAKESECKDKKKTGKKSKITKK